MHYGETIELVYTTESGYAINSDVRPFSEFDVWDEDDFLENDLAPLWPPVAHVINHTIAASDLFIDAVKRANIAIPPAIAPGYRTFVRGGFISNIALLLSLVEEDVWGESVRDELENVFEDGSVSFGTGNT